MHMDGMQQFLLKMHYTITVDYFLVTLKVDVRALEFQQSSCSITWIVSNFDNSICRNYER